MSKRDKYTFNRLVFIYISAIVLSPILFIGMTNYGLFNNYAYNKIISDNCFLAEEISTRIDNVMITAIDELENISYVFAKSRDIEILRHLMNGIVRRYSFLDKILYYNENNLLIYSYPEIRQFYNFDYSYNQRLLDAKKSGKPVWGGIHISEMTNKPSINYTIPIVSEGKVYGFIKGIINIEKLLEDSTLLNSKSENLMMIITDKHGTILAHPDKNKINLMEKFEIREKSKFGAYINEEYYLITGGDIEKTGWKLFILQSYKNAFSPLVFQRLLLIITIIAGIIICLLSLYLGYSKVFVPIKMITIYTTRISKGYYKIPECNFQIKELRRLYENFKKMMEITSQREMLLKESEKKYRNLVEENMDSIFKIDSSLKVTYVSPSIINLLGYTESEFSEIVNNLSGPNEILPERRLNIKALKVIKDTFIKESNQPPFILKVLHKDGSYRYVEIQTVPKKNSLGIVDEIQSTARDITRRFQAEKKADYFKNYLFNIIDSMPSVLLTFNEEKRVDQYNSAAIEFFNKTPQQIKNSYLNELSSDFDEYKKYFDIVKTVGLPADYNITVNSNSKIKHCKVTMFPLRSSKNIIVMRIDDVTKLSVTERQLRQAQKFKSIGNMAEGLAHDFNNILGALSGTIHLMDYKISNNLSDTIEEDIEILKEISAKGSSVIKQLTSISKPTNTGFKPYDLNLIIDAVVKELQESSKKNIVMNFNPYKSSVFIQADIDGIKEMFHNILNNSIQTIKDGGQIDISIKFIEDENFSLYNSEKESYWQISISDTSTDITKEDIDNIFDPYYKNKLTGKKQGIALSVAYNIAKNHNGYIDFFTDKDNGTTYTIYLPFVLPKKEPSEVRPKKDAVLYKGEGTILVVDDENVIRYTTGKMLQICGYNTIEAKNGEEAIKIFREKHNDIKCVILDYFMPDYNGFQVYQEFLKVRKSARVILSSGSKNNPLIENAINSGIKDFLLKPYTLEDLSEAVHNKLNN